MTVRRSLIRTCNPSGAGREMPTRFPDAMSRRLTAILAVLAFAAAALRRRRRVRRRRRPGPGGRRGVGPARPAPQGSAATPPTSGASSRRPRPPRPPAPRPRWPPRAAGCSARPRWPRRGRAASPATSRAAARTRRSAPILHPQAQGDFKGPRDVPSLWGVADTAPYGWDGHEPSLEAFAVGTIRNHFKTGETQPVATTAKQAAALVAYLRTLAPPVSAFDQGTLSAAALRGEELFQGKGGCMECHGGPFLTDALSVPRSCPRSPRRTPIRRRPPRDPGPFLRHAAPARRPQHGALRTTAASPPCARWSSSTTATPRSPRRRLTPSEIDDLVAYLESL